MHPFTCFSQQPSERRTNVRSSPPPRETLLGPTPACFINSPFTWQPEEAFKDRISHLPTYLSIRGPGHLALHSLPPLPCPALTGVQPLQLPLPLVCPLKRLLSPPQGLCTCFSLSLEHSSLELSQGHASLRLAPTPLPQRDLLQPPCGPSARHVDPVFSSSWLMSWDLKPAHCSLSVSLTTGCIEPGTVCLQRESNPASGVRQPLKKYLLDGRLALSSFPVAPSLSSHTDRPSLGLVHS